MSSSTLLSLILNNTDLSELNQTDLQNILTDSEIRHTTLQIACAFGRSDIIDLLKNNNYNFNETQNFTKMNCLHLACANGFYKIVNKLMRIVNPNLLTQRDKNNKTPKDYCEINEDLFVRSDIEGTEEYFEVYKNMKEKCAKSF